MASNNPSDYDFIGPRKPSTPQLPAGVGASATSSGPKQAPSPQYGAYAQISSQPPVQGSDMLSMFLHALGEHLQQQGQTGQQRQQLQTDQTFGRHLDMGGQPITGQQSPWSGPLTFQDQNQRIGNEFARLGHDGLTGVQAGLAPMQHNPMQPRLGQDVPQTGSTFNPFNPTTIPNPGGGFQGMINPNLPDATKYQDPNMFTARPGVSSLPPGAVAGDGTTNYRRKGAAFSFSPSYPSLQ